MRYNPTDAATIADPYPALLALQADEPAHFSPKLKAWVLTRYDDVRRALGAPEMSTMYSSASVSVSWSER